MSTRPGLNQKKILEAATAVANRVGFEQLSWTLVAMELGVKPPSLYNHTKGFDQLKAQMALEGLRRLYAVLVEEDSLSQKGRAYVHFARENPSFYAASIRAPGPGAKEQTEISIKIIEHLASLFMAQGLTQSQTVHAVRVFRSALHGFVSLEASGGFGLPEPLDETLEILLNALSTGLSPFTPKDRK